jgi:hypothetical protein
MKRLLLASLTAVLAFAASAQSVGTTTQPTVQDDVHSDVATRDVRDHNCLRETGSLITTAQNQRALRRARAQHDATVDVRCASFGRAYTHDELQRSGAIDLADALRQLDPAIH